MTAITSFPHKELLDTPAMALCSSFREVAKALAPDTPYFMAFVESRQTRDMYQMLLDAHGAPLDLDLQIRLRQRWLDLVAPHHVPDEYQYRRVTPDMTGGAITWHVDCMAGALMTTTPTTEIVLGALRERLEQYRAEEYMPFVDESVISVMPGQVIVGAAKNCPLTGVPVSFRHRAPAGADRSVIVSAVKGPCHG